MLPVPKYELGTRWVEVFKKRKYWFGYRITAEKRHVVYWVINGISVLSNEPTPVQRIAIAECFSIVDAYDIIDALNWKYADRPEGR